MMMSKPPLCKEDDVEKPKNRNFSMKKACRQTDPGALKKRLLGLLPLVEVVEAPTPNDDDVEAPTPNDDDVEVPLKVHKLKKRLLSKFSPLLYPAR